MLSLAVTSSTSVVGVAVGRPDAPNAEIVAAEVATDRRHAEEITPLIARVLAEAEVELEQVERFVVDVGPGRFTGLRVGLATVRAMALAVDRPVIGVTSLEALAGAEPERPLVAVVDARRSEVFQQRFGPAEPDPSGAAPVDRAVVGPPAELWPAVSGDADGGDPPVVVGDGGDRYAELYGGALRPGRNPSAAVLLALSADRPPRSGPEIQPQYLRDPDVHVNVKTRHTPRPS